VLNNVKIRNCSAAGVLSRNFRISSNNLLVGDCGQYALALTGGGEYFFNHSTIANYWTWSIRQSPAVIISDRYQTYTGAVQVRQILDSRFDNGIIYGSNTNEFQLDMAEPDLHVLKFRHMLFRTDQSTTNALFFPDQSVIFRNQDPGFQNITERNFTLGAGSWARNRGTSSTVEAIQDLQGNTRNCDDGQGYDLGAYEYCP
jgi:hypothetical protein